MYCYKHDKHFDSDEEMDCPECIERTNNDYQGSVTDE